MKNRMFVSILILVFTVLIVVSSCATGKKAQMFEEDLIKKLSGTWVNEDYDTVSGWASKIVVKSDGTYDYFGESYDTERMGYGEYKAIVDTWTDPEGNFFYKATIKEHWVTSVLYEIGKISSSGNEWERIWSGIDFPPEIDPNDSFYGIYYR